MVLSLNVLLVLCWNIGVIVVVQILIGMMLFGCVLLVSVCGMVFLLRLVGLYLNEICGDLENMQLVLQICFSMFGFFLFWKVICIFIGIGVELLVQVLVLIWQRLLVVCRQILFCIVVMLVVCIGSRYFDQYVILLDLLQVKVQICDDELLLNMYQYWFSCGIQVLKGLMCVVCGRLLEVLIEFLIRLLIVILIFVLLIWLVCEVMVIEWKLYEFRKLRLLVYDVSDIGKCVLMLFICFVMVLVFGFMVMVQICVDLLKKMISEFWKVLIVVVGFLVFCCRLVGRKLVLEVVV